VDIGTDLDLSLLLHSPLLLPALAVLVLLDAPFPMVPSEAALMSAFGLAAAAHQWWLVAGLVLTAFAGAAAGDVLMWRLGRTTRKLPDGARRPRRRSAARSPRESPSGSSGARASSFLRALRASSATRRRAASVGAVGGSAAAWISETVRERPGAVIVGARFVPMGRLVSTAAAGRAGVPFARFLPWSAVTSLAWSLYMLLAGLVIAPLVGGDPIRAFLAGLVMAALLGALAAAVRWLRQAWQARTARPVVQQVATV
jgi:membrane protein DedA with SNARE-associated domain